jgi:hypothetical protein
MWVSLLHLLAAVLVLYFVQSLSQQIEHETLI